MKKFILLALVFIFSISFTFAQHKPTKGTSGIGVNYRLGSTVNFPTFKYDYYITNSWVLTAFYTPSFVSSSTQSSGNSFFMKNNSHAYSQNLGLGIQKHFFDKLKIDPFVGASLSYGLGTRAVSVVERETTDFSDNKFYNKTVQKTPIANSVSAALNLGLNYFIVPNFSVGAQLDLGYGLGFINGNQTNTLYEKVTDPNGNIVLENDELTESETKQFNSSMFYAVALKTAFYFGLPNKQK